MSDRFRSPCRYQCLNAYVSALNTMSSTRRFVALSKRRVLVQVPYLIEGSKPGAISDLKARILMHVFWNRHSISTRSTWETIRMLLIP